MKHYIKSTEENTPAQIIFHIGKNNHVTNKILQLAKSKSSTKSKRMQKQKKKTLSWKKILKKAILI